MTRTIRKVLLGAMLLLGVLLVCLVLGLLPLNLFFLKSALQNQVLERAGVAMSIDGPMRLRLGLRPELTALDVRIGLPHTSHEPSVSVDAVAARFGLLAMLRGQIDLPAMSAQGIVIDPGLPERPEYLPVSLQLEASAPFDRSMTLAVKGSTATDQISFSLSGASLQDLLEAPGVFPLSLEARTSAGRVAFNGVLQPPWQAFDLSGNLIAQASDLSKQLHQFGWEVPGLGALEFESDLQAGSSSVALEGVTGRLNGLSFSGTASASGLGARPVVALQLDVPRLDTALLPRTGQGRSSTVTGEAVSLQPLFDGLARVDGTATIRIDETENAALPVSELVLRTSLEQGVLRVQELSAQVAETRLSATAMLDASATCAPLETAISFSGISPALLAAVLPHEPDLGIVVGAGRVGTTSCGASTSDHLLSLVAGVQLDRLQATTADGQETLHFNNLDSQISWQHPGRIAFDTELGDESLVVTIDFGAVAQLLSEEPWPLALDARGERFRLSMTGETAILDSSLILDLALDASLGRSDISGELAWSGADSKLPLRAHLRSSLLDLGNTVRFAGENRSGETASLRDWSEVLDEIDLLEDWLDIPGIDLTLVVSQLEGTRFHISDIALEARLEDRLLEDARMRLEFEGINMEGVLDADLRESSWILDYQTTLQNVDFNRLSQSLDLSRRLDAQVDRVDLRIASEGSTLRSLGHNLRVDSVLHSLQWHFTAGPENRRFEIDLSELHVAARPETDTVWSTSGTLNGSPVRAMLKTPTLRYTFDRSRPLPFRLVMGAGDDIVLFDALMHPPSADGVRTELRLSGRYTDGEDIDFSRLPARLEDFEISAELTIRDRAYLASDLEVRIGSSSATGAFSISPRDAGFHFVLDVESPLLETDDLVRLMQEAREVSQSISHQEPDNAGPAKAKADLLTLLDQYLQEFVGENAWHAQARVGKLYSAGNALGEARLEFTADEQGVTLEPFSIRLPGGNVDARYSSRKIDGSWNYEFDVLIEGLEYGGLLRLADPASRASGEIFLDSSLHARAESAGEVMRHLGGYVDMAIFPDDVNAGFLDLWASNLVLAVLPLGESHEKKMNCMVARFEVENGVMKSKRTFLDSTDIIVRASGEIDLGERQLDLLAIPQAKIERFLSISAPLEVSGSFDDFQVGVASGGFVMTYIRWYYGLIYVPWKWLTGERFPADGIATCYRAMDWDYPPADR